MSSQIIYYLKEKKSHLIKGNSPPFSLHEKKYTEMPVIENKMISFNNSFSLFLIIT